MIGKIIQNKYIITEYLGKGKFGNVYLATNSIFNDSQDSVERKVLAIKMEKQVHLKNAPNTLKNEARILEYLCRYSKKMNDLPQIPQIFFYSASFIPEHLVMGMTYFEGNSANQVLNIKNISHWMCSAISLLQHIHQYGVIHRDIKPAHFILQPTGKWALIDFGFATYVFEDPTKIEDIASSIQTKEYIIGTPNYIILYIHCGKSSRKKDDLISLGYIYLQYIGFQPNFETYFANFKTDNYDVYSETDRFETHHILHPMNLLRKKYKETVLHNAQHNNPWTRDHSFIKVNQFWELCNQRYLCYNDMKLVFTETI
jgi:serine/threonine-protein kinase